MTVFVAFRRVLPRRHSRLTQQFLIAGVNTASARFLRRGAKANKRSYYFDKLRMLAPVDEFGDKAREVITRGDIRKWLDSNSEKWSMALKNRYLAFMS